ncbi:MAG TPA: type II toxin-antitoxin system HicB family antitoxin [Gammaproteobacteria bacterium]|nr:type II toxin-antitoxin system HicB family antitoxin [Gammaproteobacteria bacterium]
MEHRLTMVYWKGERFWLGKLLEHPEIITQGETLNELEESLKDTYLMMVMEDVPESYQIKEIAFK